MVKAEWGAKRTCPKCNTRFYDLTKDDPVSCIACGFAWMPEPILKSKQPLPFEVAKPQAEVAEGEDALVDADADLDIDGGETPDDADVDIGGDDDLSEVVAGGDEDEV